MTEAERIESLAKRILQALDSFELGPIAADDVSDVIGVYDAGEGTIPLLVTSQGLVRAGKLIPFNTIESVQAPQSKSREDTASSRIRLKLRDAPDELIFVSGGRGRFCDSFEFARFLARAAAQQ